SGSYAFPLTHNLCSSTTNSGATSAFWHSFLRARPAFVPSAADRCSVKRPRMEYTLLHHQSFHKYILHAFCVVADSFDSSCRFAPSLCSPLSNAGGVELQLAFQYLERQMQFLSPRSLSNFDGK